MPIEAIFGPNPQNTVAFINKDRVIYASTNFTDSALVKWEGQQLNLQGNEATIEDAVFDPFSPIFLGTGTELNLWLVTNLAIYRVVNALGGLWSWPGTPTVTQEYVFASSTQLGSRVIQVSRGNFWANNVAWVAVASVYGITANPRTLSVVSRNNGVWSNEVTVFSTTINSTSFYSPTIWLSNLTGGLCEVGGVSPGTPFRIIDIGDCPLCPQLQVTDSVSFSAIYNSTNWGATWTVNPFTDKGDSFLFGLHTNSTETEQRFTAVYPNARILPTMSRTQYPCQADTYGNIGPAKLAGYMNTTQNILHPKLLSPDYNEIWTFGILGRKRGLITHPTLDDYMLMVARAEDVYTFTQPNKPGCSNEILTYFKWGKPFVDRLIWRVFISGDAGSTWHDVSHGDDPLILGRRRGWTEIPNALSRFPQEAYFSQNGVNVIILTGHDFLEYSTDFGRRWKDCRGNVYQLGEIIAFTEI